MAESAGTAIHDDDASKPAAWDAHGNSFAYTGYVIAILFGVNLFNYMDRMALAVLAPLVKQDLLLSDKQIGLLTGLAFFISYALFAIPIARLADRGIRRSIIAICVAIWSAATAISGATHSFVQLLFARVGVALGEAGSYPASSSLVCDYTPVAQRPAVFAILSFGSKAGVTVGMALAGWLGQQFGWRIAFAALGFAGLAYSILIRLTIREPIRGRFDPAAEDAAQPPLVETVRIFLRRDSYRWLIVYYVAHSFAFNGLMQWWPSYYSRSSDLGLAAVGLYVGTAIGAGSAIGLLAGGLFATRVAARGLGLPLKLGALATLLAVPTALASLAVASPTIAIIFVGATVLLWTLPSGAALSAVYSVVPSKTRAMAGAVNIFIIMVVGGLGPLAVGVVSDLLGPTMGATGLGYAMVVPAAMLTAAAAALRVAAIAVDREHRAAMQPNASVN